MGTRPAPGNAGHQIEVQSALLTIIGVFPDAVREMDLVGNTIRQETTTRLKSVFTAAGISITSRASHHDVIALPSGNWIALIQLGETYPQIPNCSGISGTIIGDALVELIPQRDGTFKLGWVWNSFDPLDINYRGFRVPSLYPGVPWQPRGQADTAESHITDRRLLSGIFHREGSGNRDRVPC